MKPTLTFLPDTFRADGADDVARMADDFAAAGAEHLVLSHKWARRLLDEPGFAADCTRAVRAAGLTLCDAHAPYGASWDLNGDQSEVDSLRRLLGECAALGIRTCTVHIGPPYGGQGVAEAVAQSCRTVEKLLPAAEDADVVLACENIYYPTTTSACLLSVLRAFESPFLRFCYDSGHANLMTSGVRANAWCDWVAAPWVKLGVAPVADNFDALRPYLVTCHLHDNGGEGDDHNLPGAPGCTVDWSALLRWLLAAPGLRSLQTEVHAAVYRLPAQAVAEAFRSLLARDFSGRPPEESASVS